MPRRDSAFWSRLTKDERSLLALLERAAKHSSGYGGGGYLPDDCSECSWCSTPQLGGGGLCTRCSEDLERLIAKATGGTDGSA